MACYSAIETNEFAATWVQTRNHHISKYIRKKKANIICYHLYLEPNICQK